MWSSVAGSLRLPVVSSGAAAGGYHGGAVGQGGVAGADLGVDLGFLCCAAMLPHVGDRCLGALERVHGVLGAAFAAHWAGCGDGVGPAWCFGVGGEASLACHDDHLWRSIIRLRCASMRLVFS